jgi:hypothetical protein
LVNVKGSLLAAAVVLTFGAASALAGATADRVQVDVSKARGTQSEATITIDPTNPQVLLAGSNTHRQLRTYAYSSTDGGATWRTQPPPMPPGFRLASDPIAAIDRTGRQYFGSIYIEGAEENPRLEVFVATRPDAASAWTMPVRGIESGSSALADKPSMAVDNSPASPYPNRVYVTWSRYARGASTIVIAHSDDGAQTWSAPVAVSDFGRQFESYSSVAVGPTGTVYVAWWDANGNGIFVDRSSDGGATFGRDVRIDPIRGRSRCHPPGIPIAAQPTNCVRPNPIVAVDDSAGPFAGRVYVTYGDTGARRDQDVFVAAFDPTFRPLFVRRQIRGAVSRFRSDQFWPASAVDASTGYLWACYYDTRGDRRRKRAWFTCTRSTDGGVHWARPVHAASVPSNETQRGADTGHHGFGREYGDYEGLAVANGVAHPIWTDSRRMRTLQEEVFTTTLSDASFR